MLHLSSVSFLLLLDPCHFNGAQVQMISQPGPPGPPGPPGVPGSPGSMVSTYITIQIQVETVWVKFVVVAVTLTVHNVFQGLHGMPGPKVRLPETKTI